MAENREPTIFVSIPSYRDPECQHTVVDLFQKSSKPWRVRIGICWQTDREEDAQCFRIDPPNEYASQVRTHFIHHSEARGPCYARALIQRLLFQDEDYYLQLDSHYRMIQGWDEELIHQLRLCADRSDQPIITTYPSSYTLPDDYAPGGADAAQLHPNVHPVVICAREFGTDGFLRIAGKVCHESSFAGVPVTGRFWAAGFAFSAGAVVKDVPYDAGLEDLFFGEEPSMTTRLWTSGWDFFAPTKVIGYHLWTRKHRPLFREHACEEQRQREAKSQRQVRELLGEVNSQTPGALGLGSRRSLADYEAFSGVSFLRRALSAEARRGGLRPDAFVGGDPVNAGESSATPSQSSSKPQPAQGSGYNAPDPNMGAAALALAARTTAPALGLVPDKAALAISSMLGLQASESSPQTNLQPQPPKLFGARRSGESLHILREEEVSRLEEQGLVVIDGFLQERCYGDFCKRHKISPSRVPLLVRCGALQVPLRAARLGRGEGMWSSTAVRGDEMAWLSVPQSHSKGLRERGERAVLQHNDMDLTDGGQAAKTQADVATAESVAPAAEFDAISSQLRSLFQESSGGSSSSSSSKPSQSDRKISCSKSVGAAHDSSSEFDAIASQLRSFFPVEAESNSAKAKKGHESSEAPKEGTSTEKTPERKEGEDAVWYEYIDVLLTMLIELKNELDGVLGFGCERVSAMVARYPGGGARYARHRDSTPQQEGSRRRLTAVFYLNPGWQAATQGGCLRAHFPPGIGQQVLGAQPQASEAAWSLDVEPVLDRLVLFSSEWLEHEVLPAHSERMAITMWLY